MITNVNKSLKVSLRLALLEHISESSYSLHIGNLDNSGRPYGGGTDSLNRMSGRGTGHFGSGTYFSTYKHEDPEAYSELINFKTDKPIDKIRDGLYIANLDEYDLYRVKNTEQANLLFDTLKTINSFFFGYAYNGKLDDYLKNSLLKIKKQVHMLNLTVPDKFFRLLSKYVDFYRDNKYSKKANDYINPSLSTLFMEMNGFNGVNVNGIPQYDNTLHGSVIYDLTKYSNTQKSTPNINTGTDYDNKEMSTKLDKIKKYGISVIDLTALSVSELNLLLKSSDTIIDVSHLNYMLQDEKITQEQISHILTVYPNIVKHKIINSDLSKVPFPTLLLVLKRGVSEFDIDELIYVIHRNFFKLRGEDEKFVLSFVNNIKDKVTEQDSIEAINDILSYL